jgi:hypothetical protein
VQSCKQPLGRRRTGSREHVDVTNESMLIKQSRCALPKYLIDRLFRTGSLTTTMVSETCLLCVLCAQEHKAGKAERRVAVDSSGGVTRVLGWEVAPLLVGTGAPLASKLMPWKYHQMTVTPDHQETQVISHERTIKTVTPNHQRHELLVKAITLSHQEPIN